MSELPTVAFGPTGELVSSIGFGAAGLGNEYGSIDDEAAVDIVRHAHDCGITYFDTSAYYGRGESERRLGLAIAPFRDEIFLATKGGRLDLSPVTGFDFSYDAIINHCEASLRRLNVDHVDLYQLHDVEFGAEDTVAEEAMAALLQLQADGKTRYVGITGYPVELLARLAGRFPVDSVLSYCRYNLMDRSMDRGLSAMARAGDITLINASVLHMGLLTNKGPQPWHPAPERIKAAARRVIAACAEAGVEVADIGMAFAHAHPDVAVTLLGSNRRTTFDRSLAACRQAVDQQLVTAVETSLGDDINLAWTSGRVENHEPGAIPPDEPKDTVTKKR